MMHKATALNEAISRTNMPKIQEILSSPEAYEIVNAEDGAKYTPIFFACMHANEDFIEQVVDLLLSKGANPLHTDINKQTIIDYLAKDGTCIMR